MNTYEWLRMWHRLLRYRWSAERAELSVPVESVQFIKCDLAFHEAEAFAGAERILTEDRPELLVECILLTEVMPTVWRLT